jgi:hypothetical protein
MASDPFDLGQLQVDPSVIKFPSKSARPKKWRRQFVRVPWLWVERLQAAKRISTYRLAHLLLYEHWRLGGRPITLSNISTEPEGLSRRSKWRSLAELERLGLIKLKRHPGRAPRVSLKRMGGD